MLVLACTAGFAAYDLRTRRVPDRALLLFSPIAIMAPFIHAAPAYIGQAPTGMAQALLPPTAGPRPGLLAAFLHSSAGAAISFLVLLAAALASKDGAGIGGGDIKLAAAMGFAYGPYRMVTILLISSCLATMFSLTITLKQKVKKAPGNTAQGTPGPLSLPFVPFLAIGSLTATVARFIC